MLNGKTVTARQNVQWLSRPGVPTVVLVEDQASEFKRSLASNLLVLRRHSHAAESTRPCVSGAASAREWIEDSIFVG